MNNEIKEICRKCEDNINCQGKGCAFRSLGNEYCNEVENANKLINDLRKQNTELKEENKRYKDLGFEHLNNKNNRLEDNWNKLKEWLEEDIKEYEESEFHISEPPIRIMTKIVTLDKIQEIEKGGINERRK